MSQLKVWDSERTRERHSEWGWNCREGNRQIRWARERVVNFRHEDRVSHQQDGVCNQFIKSFRRSTNDLFSNTEFRKSTNDLLFFRSQTTFFSLASSKRERERERERERASSFFRFGIILNVCFRRFFFSYFFAWVQFFICLYASLSVYVCD